VKIMEEIKKAIDAIDIDRVVSLVNEAIGQKVDPYIILNDGLISGLKLIGDRFGRGEAFIPELMMGANVLKSALEVLEPHLVSEIGKKSYKGRILIGTVQADLHDLGKNLVATLLSASGYEVIDLGKNVADETFVEKVKELKPDVLGLSALLTTTLAGQQRVLKMLEKAGLRGQVKVIIGGAPVTQGWANEIGADGFAEDAVGAVKLVDAMMGKGVSE